MSSPSSAESTPTSMASAIDGSSGKAQQDALAVGQSVNTFFASLVTGFIIFAAQLFIFLLIKGKFPRIYRPRTYLVPERERTKAPPTGPWHWIAPVFRTSNADFIQKCGLDAYFFLRYLRMLLKIFVPLAFLLLPILIPVNAVGGRGQQFVQGAYAKNTTEWRNVSGLDELAWGNVRPDKTNRYWAHLICAVVVVFYTCWVFYDELRGYIRLRQAYLTSPQHRLRASATTVLVTAIPRKWCSAEALDGLYDVFPGGIRNIWVNRNYDELNEKVQRRDKLARSLESAETKLIRKAKKAQLQKLAKEAKKEGKNTSREKASQKEMADQRAEDMANTAGVSTGDPHQVLHNLDQALNDDPNAPVQPTDQNGKKIFANIPIVGQGIGAVGQGLNIVGHEFNNLGRTVFGGFRAIGKEVDGRINETGGYVPHDPFNGSSNNERGGGLASNNAGVALSEEPAWKQYLKPKDRDTMRLPIFGWRWMFSLPLLGEKVDTIDYCRAQVARLNEEIEKDQREPERFPVLNSAFVQFNHQVAAHMACQTVSHHVPNYMTPRLVEISPDDVIWDNLSVTWWERYIRTAFVIAIIVGLIIGWAFPVTFTGLLSQVNYLAAEYPWLGWLKRAPAPIIAIIQGILPQAMLAILLILLPIILRLLAKNQGIPTGMGVELSVQNSYFFFLFVQVFLVVSISSGITTVITQIANEPQSIPSILASNLPKAANYFFSYLLLQALSVSAGALLQSFALVGWFIIGPLFDNTARQKWARQIDLPRMQWGTFFPVYTNLAAIGLIYSVISPLILVFCIVTFALFWIVYRYNTLYVTKFRFDTGGLLFPTAINQLFVGLYVMELCLVGLFFLVSGVDENGNAVGSPCKGQAIVMIVVWALTFLYQILLNRAFAPLFRYLPITLEDDAVLRDEEFARAQEKQWNAGRDEHDQHGDPVGDDIEDRLEKAEQAEKEDDTRLQNIEMQNIAQGKNHTFLDPWHLSAVAAKKGSWAQRPRNQRSNNWMNGSPDAQRSPGRLHHRHSRPKDVEAQRSGTGQTGETLFSGLNDEIEDLTAEERDTLVQRAFQHEALRAKRPVIWIPRDDLGVSDDEIYRTQLFSKHIWISNEYTGLDGKAKVVFRRSPPDFSEVDLIQL